MSNIVLFLCTKDFRFQSLGRFRLRNFIPGVAFQVMAIAIPLLSNCANSRTQYLAPSWGQRILIMTAQSLR